MKRDTLKRKFGSKAGLLFGENDSTREVGILATEAGKELARQLTNTWAQNPGNYNVDIIVTMEEV